MQAWSAAELADVVALLFQVLNGGLRCATLVLQLGDEPADGELRFALIATGGGGM